MFGNNSDVVLPQQSSSYSFRIGDGDRFFCVDQSQSHFYGFRQSSEGLSAQLNDVPLFRAIRWAAHRQVDVRGVSAALDLPRMPAADSFWMRSVNPVRKLLRRIFVNIQQSFVASVGVAFVKKGTLFNESNKFATASLAKFLVEPPEIFQ